jgi:cell wall-associated NlpC family hydrolase
VTLVNGVAQAPPGTPRAMRLAVRAGNRLQTKPYRFGGGHASFRDSAYDCSGAVSYVLHAAGMLASPLDSTGLASWGEPGPGSWITIYANKGHAFMYVGGLRLDTSGPGAPGPRWRTAPRSLRGFTVRHPLGY